MNHNGRQWGNAGPTRLTSALRLFCKNINSNTSFPYGSSAEDALVCIPKNETTEQNITVLNDKYAYPMHWTNWKWFLNEEESTQVLRKLNKDKPFAVHLWNYVSKPNYEYITSLRSPYAKVISRHCPIIYIHK